MWCEQDSNLRASRRFPVFPARHRDRARGVVSSPRTWSSSLVIGDASTEFRALVVLLYLLVLVIIVVDLLLRRDSGWGRKLLWLVFVVVLPFLGPFAYFASWVLHDLWRRSDLGGGPTAAWSVAVFALPYVGIVAYALTQRMGERDAGIWSRGHAASSISASAAS